MYYGKEGHAFDSCNTKAKQRDNANFDKLGNIMKAYCFIDEAFKATQSTVNLKGMCEFIHHLVFEQKNLDQGNSLCEEKSFQTIACFL